MDRPDVKERLRAELHRYATVSVYLYVCFSALLLYKYALLREAGPAYLPLGLAAVKALILGKFVLIGEAARLGSRLKSRSLLQLIAHRALLFLLLLIVLTLIEEIVVGWVHGHSMTHTLAEYSQRSPLELLATCLLILLVLVLLVAVTEVSRVLGSGALRRLLLAPPHRGAELGRAGDGRAGASE